VPLRFGRLEDFPRLGAAPHLQRRSWLRRHGAAIDPAALAEAIMTAFVVNATT
jgi:hypothetical protein